MQVRTLRPDEHERWLDLRERLWPDFSRSELGEDEIVGITASERGNTFVAEVEGGTLVGFVEVTLHEHAEGCSTSPVGYIEGWYVEPEHRGRGVGRELIRAAEAWTLGRGATEIASDTELHNVGSRGAHAALGFREVESVVLFAKRLR